MTSYFEEKMPNTEIKHFILRKMIESAICISSVAGYSEPHDIFSYTDLYAGSGRHTDSSLGSPLIALETISNTTINPEYPCYKCFFSEIDSERCEQLQQELSQFKENLSNGKRIDVTCVNDSWENLRDQIVTHLRQTKWGFIFADPFANQINLDLLFEILNTDHIYNFKDILIFVNYNSLQRLIGEGSPSNIDKVTEFLGMSRSDLDEAMSTGSEYGLDFVTLNRALIKRLNGTNKEFIVGTSLPSSRNGKLTRSDYYFLVLCTTADDMVDNFFKSLGQKICNDTQWFSKIENKVRDMINDPISLYNLYHNLVTSFVSWRDDNISDVPTKKNIIQIINSLSESGDLEFHTTDNDVIDKRSKRVRKLKLTLRKNKMNKVTLREK